MRTHRWPYGPGYIPLILPLTLKNPASTATAFSVNISALDSRHINHRHVVTSFMQECWCDGLLLRNYALNYPSVVLVVLVEMIDSMRKITEWLSNAKQTNNNNRNTG